MIKVITLLILILPIAAYSMNQELEEELQKGLPSTEEDITVEEDTKEPKPPIDTNIPTKQSFNFKKIAILQGINKITTKTSILKIPVNSSIRFGNLVVAVNSCWKAPADAKPENKILVNISEKIPGEERDKEIFYGWMLSSSPALSSITHPVYDIVPLSCQD